MMIGPSTSVDSWQTASTKVAIRLLLAGCLLMLSGCLGAAPGAASQSEHGAERVYTDPKALALAVAAERNDVAEVRRLMKEEKVNPDRFFGVGGDEGLPLVAWPVITKSPEGLRALLENGADPNVAAPYPLPPDRTPRNADNAMVWAAKADDPIYLKLLLDHGGDPNTRNANRETLMYQALIMGDGWEKVKLLVERGADVNTPNAGGLSPIVQEYADFANFPQVYWLLEHGADPTLQYMGDVAKEPVVHRKDSYTIDSIFWYPVNPVYKDWQRKCQVWLLKRGYERPPMSALMRKKREDFKEETDPAKIPLPDLRELEQEVAP
jgi:hypothetical protein